MDFNLDIPKMGYFILYKKDDKFNLIQNLIYKEQISEGFSKEDSEYIHVEVSLGGGDAIRHSFPLAKLIKITKKHKGKYIKIVAYDEHNYYKFLRYKVAVFAASLNNTAYNLFSLLWFRLNNKLFKNNNILASRHMPFCSFSCAWALKKVFPDSFENSSTVMPAAFLDKDKFIVIWEGYI